MPHFRHDCMNPNCCRYVGSTQHKGADGRVFDVYAYTNMMKEPSIIIRFSDEGSDYRSMPVAAYRPWVEKDPVLRQALDIYDNFHRTT